MSWPLNPVDLFILAKLENKGITPSPKADNRSLLRRLSFDLTGLPPSPEELRVFLEDDKPGAWSRAVDRLLASPAYGERWGRHWLDLVRFAETSGHEFDFDIPNAWKYRDYVIRAINEDTPYDQFALEHIAGDLLPSPRRHPNTKTNESILGTGFWFLGESKHSPVDLRVDGADRRDNMIDVFGKSFLGLTLACARCHDHKFDPIPTRDYYSLVSVLQSSRFQQAFLDSPDRQFDRIESLLRLRLEAESLSRAESLDFLTRRVSVLNDQSFANAPSNDALFGPVRELFTNSSYASAKANALREGKQPSTKPSQTVLFSGSPVLSTGWQASGEAFISHPGTQPSLDIDSNRSVPVVRSNPGIGSGRLSNKLQGALRSPLFTIDKKFIHYRVKGNNARCNLIIDGFQQIRDPIYGVLTFSVDSPEWTWRTQDIGRWKGLFAYIEFLDDADGLIDLDRVITSDDPSPPIEGIPEGLSQLIDRSKSSQDFRDGFKTLIQQTLDDWKQDKLRPEQNRMLNLILRSKFLVDQTEPKPKSNSRTILAEKIGRIRAIEASLESPTRGIAMADGNGVEDRVHIRGNPKTLGPLAPRKLPSVVAGENTASSNTGSGRFSLGKQLVSSNNPLFSRVIVNRLWQHHFGQGIVRTPDDFGRQGELPTHPELLDWLAGELIRSGWSIKHLQRIIVHSQTYQMSSQRNPLFEPEDPRNELLHRMPVKRLEGEVIRDSLLFVSGKMDRQMFGKGPYPHLTSFMVGRGRPGHSGPLDGDGRRTVYLHIRRNFLDPFLLAFDYPVPFSTMGRRGVSSVPAQALALLNHPLVVTMAQSWAQKELAIPALTSEERIDRMFESALGHPPTKDERAQSKIFVEEQTRFHGGNELQAWADFAHVLFNSKEFLFIN